jgi:hypothetical protein
LEDYRYVHMADTTYPTDVVAAARARDGLEWRKERDILATDRDFWRERCHSLEAIIQAAHAFIEIPDRVR